MIAGIIVGLAAYFWVACICYQIQIHRLGDRDSYADKVDAAWAGIFWFITILVWTGKAVGDWIDG